MMSARASSVTTKGSHSTVSPSEGRATPVPLEMSSRWIPVCWLVSRAMFFWARAPITSTRFSLGRSRVWKARMWVVELGPKLGEGRLVICAAVLFSSRGKRLLRTPPTFFAAERVISSRVPTTEGNLSWLVVIVPLTSWETFCLPGSEEVILVIRLDESLLTSVPVAGMEMMKPATPWVAAVMSKLAPASVAPAPAMVTSP